MNSQCQDVKLLLRRVEELENKVSMLEEELELCAEGMSEEFEDVGPDLPEEDLERSVDLIFPE